MKDDYKENIENRTSFFDYKSEINYKNDILCMINDEHQLIIITIPKCGTSTIRRFINFREKLMSQLNDKELAYTRVCFVRPVEDRFYSALNTVLYKREKMEFHHILKNLIQTRDRDGIVKFITDSRECHTASLHTHIKDIKNVHHIYNLNVLKRINLFRNTSVEDSENLIESVREMKIFEDPRIQEYYSRDHEYYSKSSMYVIPKVNEIFDNKLCIQKYLFILTPANCGSTAIASLIDSSLHTSFAKNFKYEGLLEVEPRPLITKSDNWYNRDCKIDCNDILKIKWEDKYIKCDKYPPYMIRAKDIEEYFEKLGQVYFICSTRHPYSSKHQMEWNEEIEIMYRNIETLKNVHFLRYEDLLYNYETEKERLLKFLPDLIDIDKNKVVTSHASRGKVSGIVDLQNYNKSRGNFNLEYMKKLGYTECSPYVLNT